MLVLFQSKYLTKEFMLIICSLQLRAGCLTIAIVSIIFDLLNIVILVGGLVVESESLDTIANAGLEKVSFEQNDPWFSEPVEESDKLTNIQLGLEGIDILISVISVVTSSLLIFGICQSRYKFIFPTLVWMPLDFAIYLVSILVIFLFDVYDFNNDHVIVISVEIVLNLSISLICWIAVFSFWQQVIKSQIYPNPRLVTSQIRNT